MHRPASKTAVLDALVRREKDPKALIQLIQPLLRALLAQRDWLDEQYRRPVPGKVYSQYSLYMPPDEAWRAVAFVWPRGATTPVHDHGTWGVIGVYQLIQIDLDPTQVGKNYPAEVCLLGDANAVLQQVLDEVLRAGPQERPSRTAEVAAARTAGYHGLKEQFPRELRILEEIRELLPRNGVLCAQSIIGHWSREAFPVYEPRTYLYANSFGSMGWTFQAGFGAKFALPEPKVVTICGDGGMMVNCGELASAVENGVKMPVVLFNNGGYYIMKLAQEQRYDRHYMGVDLHNPDFVKLAEAFGARGVRLSAMDEFEPALKEALEADALTLIEYPILLNPPSQR